MKTPIKIVLLGLVIFSSCTLMKRKYLPGYTVQWKGKNTAAHFPAVKKSLPVERLNKTAATPLSPINIENTSNTVKPVIQEKNVTLTEKNTRSHEAYREPAFPTDTLKKATDTSSATLPMEPNAAKSAHKGWLAVLMGGLSVLMLLAGPSLGSGTALFMLTFTVFILLGLLCLMFAIDAINFAIKAVRHISKEPGKYSGLGSAILALILGIICILYCVIIVIAFASVLESGAL